ncbi:hypothetical protein [Macrococcus equipercicus]|uniref:Uncharacterized protein n=1 Tax=Macrococcus equipercicus TaxID=69967 RepID=A0A9Q9F1J2_9STAP|nr:hypothetical protein [Macrococcus equipercicus]KAA1039661.1 hypothetical protein ERX35_006190 [Macrococcus equipercicus]UTH13992.1 hypothetical protein KFV11_01050 [Macrococcus equipercicus]
MFKNILLAVLMVVNIVLIFLFQTRQAIYHLDISVVAVGLTLIISILFLIVKPSKMNMIFILIALLIALYHASLLVMRVYHYVY